MKYFLVLTLLCYGQQLLAGITHWGDKVKVGNGYARTYIVMDNKTPTSIGVALTSSALSGLPHEMKEFTLPLPKTARVEPYKHLTLDWNPHGHEPGGVYDKPHFDYHFYFISSGEREMISCMGPDAAVCLNMPDANEIPANYAPTPEGVPKMGWHWVDLLAPEFNGGLFTRTFIYGYYGGELIFIEPMITQEYLLSKKSSTNPIRMPQTFPYAVGLYPESYKVFFDSTNKLHKVELTNLKERP